MAAISATVAAAQLRAFVEQIELEEEEIRERNANKSEIYKEAKFAGFDVKVVRKVVAARRMDRSERAEADAMFDLYMTALGEGGNLGSVSIDFPADEEPAPKPAKPKKAKNNVAPAAPAAVQADLPDVNTADLDDDFEPPAVLQRQGAGHQGAQSRG